MAICLALLLVPSQAASAGFSIVAQPCRTLLMIIVPHYIVHVACRRRQASAHGVETEGTRAPVLCFAQNLLEAPQAEAHNRERQTRSRHAG
jgi:hypothetical protein